MFFFLPLQQWGGPHCQHWDSALSHQTVSGAPQQWQPKHCLCVSSLSPRLEPDWAGCWQEAVSSCDVWSGICACEEVNYTTFKTLICFTIHTVANHIQDTRLSKVGWQLCPVATVAVMADSLAGSVCPAVCLFEMVGSLVQFPPPYTVIHS